MAFLAKRGMAKFNPKKLAKPKKPKVPTSKKKKTVLLTNMKIHTKWMNRLRKTLFSNNSNY